MADPTIGELVKAGTITDDEVNAAVEVFMRDPTVSLFRFVSGHTLNPAAAVRAHEPAQKAVVNPDWTEKYRRGMVRTAIILARPAAPSADAYHPENANKLAALPDQALGALRAVALHPRGMLTTRHPKGMVALIKLGYAAERPARWDDARSGETGWFITPAGLELLDALRARDNG